MRVGSYRTGVLGGMISGFVAGLFYGTFCFGPLCGFAIALIVAAFEAAPDKSPFAYSMILANALYCSPGAAIGGACGASWMRPAVGAWVGLGGAICTSCAIFTMLCFAGDFDWSSDLLVMGLPPLIAAPLAGACVGALHAERYPVINPWDKIEDA